MFPYSPSTPFSGEALKPCTDNSAQQADEVQRKLGLGGGGASEAGLTGVLAEVVARDESSRSSGATLGARSAGEEALKNGKG
jgi:hypothetical protein